MPVKTFLSSFFMCNTYSCSARRASFEKVASCNPSGELHLSPSAIAELIACGNYALESLSSTAPGAVQAISFARFCREHGQERTAISALKEIWRGIHISSRIWPAQLDTLKEHILHEVSLLWFSPDDCVWEEASQFL